jgi:hypothetical protein
MTRKEWLQQIRTNDLVAVYFGSQHMSNEVVTSAPRTLVTVGKHARKVSFSRADGYMAGGKPMARWFHIERE